MPKHIADREIGKRSVEELYRVFPNLSESKIAKRLGVDRKSFYEWKNGVTPSGHVLSALCFEGCDIKYILTGRRNNHE